jgi:hypothetical protein
MPTDMTAGGPYSELIERAVRIPRNALRESTLGHQEALEELASVCEQCRDPDWDGFGALAIEPATFTAAYMLIDSLPLGFLRPSIGAEPDGHITLEWRRSPRRVLSVSVDLDGFLHYAGLFGSNRRYGSLAFFSTAPDELLQLVRDL